MPASSSRLPSWAGPLLSLAMVAAATFAAWVAAHLVGAPNTALVFVLPVVIAAVSFGWSSALTAAVAGALAYNFFLIPPFYTLRIAEPANVWSMLLLLVVATVVSAVAALSRRRAVEAVKAAAQAAALQSLARDLAGTSARDKIVAAGAAALHQLFEAPAVILAAQDRGLALVAATPRVDLSPADSQAAAWALASRLPSRARAYPNEAAAFDFWPLVTPNRSELVLGVAFDPEDRPDAPEAAVDAVAGYLGIALDREAYAQQLTEVRIQTAGEQLKADLLAAVSHDLRTPLSTILVTLQSLKRFSSQDAAERAKLLDLAESETERLSAMVAALLDMNRLEAGAVTPRQDAAAPADLVSSAVKRAKSALAGRRLVQTIPPDCPPFLVDPSLFESALANVLENAGRYSPKGSRIDLRVGADAAKGWVEVLDGGPGFPEPVEALFGKFTRGVTGDGRPPGVGLGLAIARGFTEIQGGTLEAGPRNGRPGARVRFTLPLAPHTGGSR